MALIRPHMIHRADLRVAPTALFLFGDCVLREGYGSQAREMRGEPNAVGVPTKWRPDNTPGAFFDDRTLADYPHVRAAIDEAFEVARAHLGVGYDVVVPADGLGTGLAALATRASSVLAYICSKITELQMISDRLLDEDDPQTPKGDTP